MKKSILPLYYIVDEQLIMKFSDSQRVYMMDYYYSLYTQHCSKVGRKQLSRDIFFTNMRRRKVKIIQICCPYCGEIRSIVVEGTIQSTLGMFNYCYHCGKPSTKEHVFKNYARLYRIISLHRLGISKLLEVQEVDDLKLYTYDIMQLELVEIESTFEMLMREFYSTLLFIKYRNVKDNFLKTLIEKDVTNDFLNIEKANNHFKKALGINLKSELDPIDWTDLIDLANLRNTIIHNDGKADLKFGKSQTYKRVQHMIEDDLIFISAKDIKKYLSKTFKVMEILNQKLKSEFDKEAPTIIANRIFNRQ